MTKNYYLTLVLFCLAFGFSYGQMSDLIISEYGEGSSNNKYVEIYNGTGAPVDLGNYEIWRISNGGTWTEASISLSGTLAHANVYIIANNSSNATILAEADLTSGVVSWNGDDAVGLAKDISGTFTLIDAVGTDGADPGSGWDVAGTSNATANQTLVRKSSICDPNINWSTSAGTNTTDSEWTVYANDTWTYLGSHTETCSSTNTIVEFLNTSSTVIEDGLFIEVCAGISNPSATIATTVDITLDASSTATNGTDYDDGAGTPGAITFPQTLTFPVNDSSNQCITIFISNDDVLVEGDETVVLNLSNASGGDSASLGTNTQHILTITDNDVSAVADVVITEVMYNTTGADDEWIEICNTSGSTQILNDYTIEVGGFTEFTFPSSGVVIADGACITISLGSNGDGTYNNDCPFTPDYGIDASTSNTDNLVNNSNTITLIASDGSTIIDDVLYDDNDESLTDGNGSSFHVIDASLDNSDTDTNWQAVVDGGSPGTNSLVSPCSALEPEINIEGDIGAFPDISNGDITPSFLDNTEFSSQIISVGSQTKSFIIENLGLVDLSVSNIEIIGADAADFTVTLPSALPLIITSNTEVTFDVTFAPLSAAGIRNATVRITNNDSSDGEGEEIYEFAIRGEAICDAASNIVSPLTGPVNTVVTISGTDLDGSTSVTYDGVTVTHTFISATEIEFSIPNGALSGNIEVTNNINCQSAHAFTLIDNTISSCEGNGGVTPTDLFISEITDKGTGSHSYIELYNGTGAIVDLTDYEIRIHNNGDATTSNIADLTGSMPNNTTYVIAVGGTNASDPEGGYTADEFYGFGGINDNDNIRLYFNDGINPETWVDLWGDTSGATFTISTNDYNYRRKNTGITVPSTTWDSNDWDILTPLDYSNIGVFDFSTGVPPTVTLQPVSTAFDCTFSASYTITGTEGYNGTSPADTKELAYQWYYNAPGSVTWTEILASDADYAGQQSATLTITDTSNFNGYQYYCQLREDSATCFEASNAVKLEALSSTWDGTSWSTPPSIDRAVIIDGDYDTSVVTNGETSFSGCSLIVNAGYELQVSNGNYIEIENDIIADGDITVFTAGSVVQNNDLATVTANGTITVQKETSMISTPYQYTYWSSPVVGETIENVFSTVPVSRRFVFIAANFIDTQTEIGNTNTFTPGPDDIDDNGDDWQPASGTMLPGVGYAATASSLGMLPANQQFTFVGAFNNGVITPTVEHVTGSAYSDWNFIGNPYPSAIDTNAFFTVNSGTVNTIYLWSHATPENINASGNEGANFAQSDYAIISGSGVNTAGGSGVIPNDFVPSGQGFFIETLDTSPITFNNAMRVTGNNDQFFRSETTETSRNVLWLNLSSDNGVSKQIAVAHLDGATDSYDGSFYDVTENKSSALAATFYSIISDSADEQFVIQGKDLNSLDLDEIIPLGFKTTIDVATLYTISIAQFEGDFYTNNDVYIKDDLLNTTHNLKTSDYTFTSEPGEFNNRFEIVFTTQALSIDDIVMDTNSISIVELNDGQVQFKLNSKELSISNVEILDVLGRRIYNLQANSTTEVYNLSKLSQAAYIARITLSNGQVISKKAVKK